MPSCAARWGDPEGELHCFLFAPGPEAREGRAVPAAAAARLAGLVHRAHPRGGAALAGRGWRTGVRGDRAVAAGLRILGRAARAGHAPGTHRGAHARADGRPRLRALRGAGRGLGRRHRRAPRPRAPGGRRGPAPQLPAAAGGSRGRGTVTRGVRVVGAARPSGVRARAPTAPSRARSRRRSPTRSTTPPSDCSRGSSRSSGRGATTATTCGRRSTETTCWRTSRSTG